MVISRCGFRATSFCNEGQQRPIIIIKGQTTHIDEREKKPEKQNAR